MCVASTGKEHGMYIISWQTLKQQPDHRHNFRLLGQLLENSGNQPLHTLSNTQIHTAYVFNLSTTHEAHHFNPACYVSLFHDVWRP